MTKKELTHIEHIFEKDAVGIGIGSDHWYWEERLSLFEKSLILTSDLKRLPYMLGGKVFIQTQAELMSNMLASAVGGLEVTILLMNGYYTANDYDRFNFGEESLVDDSRAVNDILLICHGRWHFDTTNNLAVAEVQESHWDFEGQKLLFDTVTMLSFARTNVAVANAILELPSGICEFEVDWRPVNKPELIEFMLEHIYAREGD